MNTWPSDPPSITGTSPPSPVAPELTYDGKYPPSPQEKAIFAAQAYEYFCRLILDEVNQINHALLRYQRGQCTLEEYQNALINYRALLAEPKVTTSSPHYHIDQLEITTETRGDYLLGISISGVIRFPGSLSSFDRGTDPDGESSYSSSSFAALPARWP